MGIKILKPEVYLGSSKIYPEKFSKKYFYEVKKKIGSKVLHVERKKSILEMAITASKKTLKKSNADLNFLIFVSQGQDRIFPSCAEALAEYLKLKKKTFVLTISSGCSGFVQAVVIANKLLDKKNKNGLIVCVEKYSKYISDKDLKTKVLFSDAATATLVKFNKKKNLISMDCGFDGKNSESLKAENKNGKNILYMNGQKVFLFGLNNIPESIKKVSNNNYIDKYLIHNGSKIMLDSIVKKAGIEQKKVCTSYKITGNTVSSSIPLLINLNYKSLSKKNILMSGFGVGLSWATLLIKWI